MRAEQPTDQSSDEQPIAADPLDAGIIPPELGFEQRKQMLAPLHDIVSSTVPSSWFNINTN